MDTLLSKLRGLPESTRRGIAWGVTAVVGAAGLYWWVIQQFISPR